MEDDNVLLDGKTLGNLRVVDLKQELEKRGLSKSGSKKDLVKRLKQQLEFEKLCGERKLSGDGETKLELDAVTEQNEFVQQYLAQQQKIIAEQKEAKRLIELEEIQKSSDEKESCESTREDEAGTGDDDDDDEQTESDEPEVLSEVKLQDKVSIPKQSTGHNVSVIKELAPKDHRNEEKEQISSNSESPENKEDANVQPDIKTLEVVTPGVIKSVSKAVASEGESVSGTLGVSSPVAETLKPPDKDINENVSSDVRQIVLIGICEERHANVDSKIVQEVTHSETVENTGNVSVRSEKKSDSSSKSGQESPIKATKDSNEHSEVVEKTGEISKKGEKYSDSLSKSDEELPIKETQDSKKHSEVVEKKGKISEKSEKNTDSLSKSDQELPIKETQDSKECSEVVEKAGEISDKSERIPDSLSKRGRESPMKETADSEKSSKKYCDSTKPVSNMDSEEKSSSVPYSVKDIQLPESPGKVVKQSLKDDADTNKTVQDTSVNGVNSTNELPSSEVNASEQDTENIQGTNVEIPDNVKVEDSVKECCKSKEEVANQSLDKPRKRQKVCEEKEEPVLEQRSKDSCEETSSDSESRRKRKSKEKKRKHREEKETFEKNENRESPVKESQEIVQTSDSVNKVSQSPSKTHSREIEGRPGSTITVVKREPIRQKLKIKRDNVIISQISTDKGNLNESEKSKHLIEGAPKSSPDVEENALNKDLAENISDEDKSKQSPEQTKEATEDGEIKDSPEDGEIPKELETSSSDTLESPMKNTVQASHSFVNTQYVSRKISLSSRKLSQSSDDKPKVKRSKWGSLTTSQKPNQAISISTDSLKNWFPDFKLLKDPVNEVTVEEPVLREETDLNGLPKKDSEDQGMSTNFKVTRHDHEEEKTEQMVEESGPVSRILFVKNLVRPFTLNQLKELLKETGNFSEDNFWIDKIKSKCFVIYETEDEAVKTKKILNGMRWPSSNPKILSVDFSNEDELNFHKSGSDLPKPPVTPLVPEPMDMQEHRPSYPLEEYHKKDHEKDHKRERSKHQPMREWDKDKISQESPEKERNMKDTERLKSHDKKEKKDSKRRANEDTPAKLLDDLFQKTKSLPCIYWLPLTDEQVLEHAEMKRLRRLEREKRNQKREQEESEQKSKQQRSRNRPREPELKRSASRSRSPVPRRR